MAQFAEKLERGIAPDSEFLWGYRRVGRRFSHPAQPPWRTKMKHLYKPALVIFASYALSALAIWSHG